MGLKGCLESFVLSTLSQEPIVMVSCAGRGVCDPTETRIDGGITRRRHGTVFPTISLRGWRGGFRHICLGGIWRRLRRLRRARGQSTMREEELCLLEHPWRDYLSVAQQGQFLKENFEVRRRSGILSTRMINSPFKCCWHISFPASNENV